MDINNSLDNQPSTRYQDICLHFKLRQDAIVVIQHLVKTIRSIQQHRGMSMGFLGGDHCFQNEIVNLQNQLERRINILHTLTSQGNILSEVNKNNLINGWSTISRNWQDDSVIDNYELHCHLIDQFLHALNGLSRELEKPISIVADTDNTDNESLTNHLKVLHFTTHLLPSLIERIGRVRALATYAAAAETEDTLHAHKLRYAIQCLTIENEKFHEQAIKLKTFLPSESTLLTPLKSYDVKLMFLLKIIENDVLKKSKNKADGHHIYNLSTDIIDKYVSMVKEGMALVSEWHETDLENWLIA